MERFESATEPDCWELLARVDAGDPALSTLDLSANRQILALDSGRKSAILERLATAPAVHILRLDALALDHTNASALRTLVATTRARILSLERNLLTEEPLKAIADGIASRSGAGSEGGDDDSLSLAECALAEQRLPLTTFATNALLDAMEQVRPDTAEQRPSLVPMRVPSLRVSSRAPPRAFLCRPSFPRSQS